ncbi:amino acid ABC transporter ATP-binding/permease protein [Lacrimispora sp.]|uniref:amino acid ABC transporter ATP-binding/permease protein n=1 Tax=Lacrimispora sp. TaxID=2719234 RepID=UPI00399437CF
MHSRRSGIKIMGRLIGLIKPLILIMLFAVTLGVTGYLCAILLTVYAAAGILLVLDFPLPFFFPASIKGIFIVMAVLSLLRGILHYGEQDCNHYIAFKLLADIRGKVFQALRALCPAKLEGRDKGNLISVITSDIELLEVFYAHTISPVCIAFLSSLFMVLFMGSIHPFCGLLAFAGYVTVGVLLPVWNSKRGSLAGVEYRSQFGMLNSFILDSLRGLRETIQYGQERTRLMELEEGSEQLSRCQSTLKKLEGSSAAVTGACMTGFSFIMLFLTLWLNQKEAIGFDGAVLATVATMSSFGPVIALSGLSNNLNQTLACGERVLSVLEEAPEVWQVSGKPETGFFGAAADHVTFSYEEETVLNDISMDIPKKKIIGIHGKSGSGKSTLLKLFMRFWDVKEGQILVSGRNVKDINTNDLRNMEGYVTQDTVLFCDTIANNISVGRAGASREEIMEAARKASLHDFISSLPDGYDTSVGELGDRLSGGERQRIGIARAFLHNAPLLLLDEPTSNLDSLNEGIILKALKEEREERTVVIVSHRASTMNVADEIWEMDGARIS